MKNLNDGQVHLFKEMDPTQLSMHAKQFAEGDETLEQILLKLWSMGFETFSSCKGYFDENHTDENQVLIKLKYPFLSILVKPEDNDKVLKLIKYINSSTNKFKPNCSFIRQDLIVESADEIKPYTHAHIVNIGRTFALNKSCKKMWNSVLNSLNKLSENANVEENKSINFMQKLHNILKTSRINHPHVQRIEIQLTHKNILKYKVDGFKPLLNMNVTDKNIDNICKNCNGLTCPIVMKSLSQKQTTKDNACKKKQPKKVVKTETENSTEISI